MKVCLLLNNNSFNTWEFDILVEVEKKKDNMQVFIVTYCGNWPQNM